MALDEALLESAAASTAAVASVDAAATTTTSPPAADPVLRVYGWQPAALSLGRFLDVEVEVNTELAAELGIDIVRRSSGGGTVFHHKEATYSLVIPPAHPIAALSVNDSFAAISEAIINALSLMGLAANFAPINDILVNGKKVSGNAQTRRAGALLHHGTILLDLDRTLMFRLLRGPKSKNPTRVASVTELRNSNDSAPTNNDTWHQLYAEASTALIQSFSHLLGPATNDQITPEETSRTETLAMERFAAIR
jgi:lipoate-protein ligase A